MTDDLNLSFLCSFSLFVDLSCSVTPMCSGKAFCYEKHLCIDLIAIIQREHDDYASTSGPGGTLSLLNVQNLGVGTQRWVSCAGTTPHCIE